MPDIELRDGSILPRLGLGTWKMTEGSYDRRETIAALRKGIELGISLVDTAEVYGDGDVELLVAEAIAGRRDEIYLVSKVAPFNAGREATILACEGSLRRLSADRLDLYLLHWKGEHPIEDTIEALERLREGGKIGRWGVSNFDLEDMIQLEKAGGTGCVANQIQFNPVFQAPLLDVMPWQAERGIATMAYSPLAERDEIFRDEVVQGIAANHGATPAQVILAWIMAQDLTMTIPKASSMVHAEENAAALRIELDPDDVLRMGSQFASRAREFYHSCAECPIQVTALGGDG